VAGQVVTKPSHRVSTGAIVELELPPPTRLDVEAVEMPLDVLYEDADLIVVNKAAGMVVHPAPGHLNDTLVNALLAHVRDLSGIGGVARPGIVHRLDKDTSGVIVVAKTDKAHEGLATQFAAHSIEREYEALAVRLSGIGLEDEGTIETLHGRHPTDRKRFSSVSTGKRAVTHYRVVHRYSGGALRVLCRLETGRTHQIRVHLAERGCPLIGDQVYGGRTMKSVRLIRRQALHARMLGFEHPRTGARLQFEGDVPDDFRRAQEHLERGGDWRR